MHVPVPKQINKYIVVGSTETTTAANDVIIATDIRDIKSTISEHCNCNIIVVAEDGQYLERLVQAAFESGTKLRLNNEIEYNFDNIFEPNESRGMNLFKLLSVANEPVLAGVVIKMLFKYLKNVIPHKYELDAVLDLIRQHTNELVDNTITVRIFRSLYEKHKNNVISTIKPSTHPNLISKAISYPTDLATYLIQNNGIFGLVAPMAAGKTANGILPLFEACIRKLNKKVVLITPTIALSKALAQGFDKSLHYQQHENVDNVDHLPGLICCVNSLVTKDNFFRYAKSCDVILVDEWGECLSQLTEHLFQDNKLSNRAALTEKLYSLLGKDKVVLADALFSDMNARHILQSTNRELTLLNCSDTAQRERTVTLYSRSMHVDTVINQTQASKCEVGFCDGGQKLSSTYFDLGNVVKDGLEGKVNLINADYLQSPEGLAFIKNPLKKIQEAMFTLFSPAITSGQHFPFEQFIRINLFASETISPLKLVQSSGRFRNASNIQLSFSERRAEYHNDHIAIRTMEVLGTTTVEEFAEEMDAVIGNPWAERIVERIAQDRMLRQHYANNSLILFEQLGARIIRKDVGKGKAVPKISKSEAIEYPLELLSDEMYQTMLTCLGLLNDKQRQQVKIYETLAFFNVLHKPAIHQETLEFDQDGKGQICAKNTRLIRGAETDIGLSSEDKLRQLVIRKMLDTVGIDAYTFTGAFGYPQIAKLENFFQSGCIKLMGSDIQMKHIGKSLFDIPNKSYQNKGAFSKLLLDRLLGLKQIRAGRDKSKSSGEYSYQVCPESAKRLNYFYGLSADNTHSRESTSCVDSHLAHAA